VIIVFSIVTVVACSSGPAQGDLTQTIVAVCALLSVIVASNRPPGAGAS
jgi:hypothetical protein